MHATRGDSAAAEVMVRDHIEHLHDIRIAADTRETDKHAVCRVRGDEIEAHIMATKGAETDAMKRAMMMLGDAFGLGFRKDDTEESQEEEEAKKFYNADGTEDTSFEDLKIRLATMCNLYFMTTNECGYLFAFGEDYAEYIKNNVNTFPRITDKGTDMHKWFTKGIVKLEEWRKGHEDNNDFIDDTMKPGEPGF